jgi:hypothetical protein
MMVISLTISDANNTLSTVTAYSADDALATVTDLFTDYVTVFWNAVKPLITGLLVGANVGLEMDITGLSNNTYSALSDVEEKAEFVFRVGGGGKPVRMTLPTIKESIFENAGAGANVDRTNSDVVAFLAVMTFDVVDDGISATDSHGSDLTSVVSAKQLFRGK